MSSVSQITSSIRAVAERFNKLYRTLYMQFLFNDFIHKDDVQRMFNELHQRITQVEANASNQLKAGMSSLNANIASHTHMVPQAPSGVLPTASTIFVSAPPVPPTPVPVVPWAETRHIQRLQEEIGKGPSVAPFADSYDPQVVAANIGILKDVGV